MWGRDRGFRDRLVGDGGCRLVFGWFWECQIVVHAGEEINFRFSINLVQIQLDLLGDVFSKVVAFFTHK